MKYRVAAVLVLLVALLLTWGLEGRPSRAAELGDWSGRPSQDEVGSAGPAASDVQQAVTVVPAPQVQAMIDQVDGEPLVEYIGDLSGEWPVLIGGDPYTITTRYTYSGEPIQKSVEFVGQHLEALGLEVEYHSWQPGLPPNVIGEQQGETRPDDIFLLSAHLDSTASGSPMVLAPGADDNASGVAAVLLAADILSQYEGDCTLRFALWTGEEQGRLGSQSYAERASIAGERIGGVLNLDMIGWDAIEGPDIDLHANQSVAGSTELAQLFAGVVEAYDLRLVPEIVTNGSGASDHASFWQYGYTAILGIEDYFPSRHDFNPNYHTGQDRLDALDLQYLVEYAKAAIATFAHMGCLVPERPYDWHSYLPLVVR
jgi:hypothetical protein